MTIRRKLGFTFGVILGLFGLNLAIYSWSAAQRNRTVDALGRAISRQTLLANASQSLNNLHQQISLLSGVSAEAGQAGASAKQRNEFAAELEKISRNLRDLESLADPDQRTEIEKFRTTFEQLARSWTVYYENFGVHPNVAVVELAVRADPLSEGVLKRLVPRLQETEQQRVEQAKTDFSTVSHITDRVTVVIFLLSLAVAISLSVRVVRQLALSISDLILGTSILSIGILDHRIPVEADDEVGKLARSFNEMANSLSAAQEKVKQRTQELEQTNRALGDKNIEIEKQKQISEQLLLNILPAVVAEELQTKGSVSPKYFEDVTILFTDFVGFTKASEKLAVEDLVHVLHEFFTNFDRVVKKYGLEKLKTIGDSYMCVGGIPIKNSSHPVDAVLAAFEILEAIAGCNQRTRCPWSIRVGIHTGPVAAGVVGVEKFAFDVWGDTVNFAARLQATSQPNRINISATTYSRVKDFFKCSYRGKIETKEKQAFDMYFVSSLHPDLQNGEGSGVPQTFARRYHIYFSKTPPAFPASLLTRPASLPQ